jgi:hypothetical protein
MFKFADTALKNVFKVLKPHEDELTRAIKDTMPGLVQAHADVTSSTQNALVSVAMLTDERGLSNQHHRLLTKPDAFHVSVLFQPTLVFLERIAEISPDGSGSSGTGGTMLDEFVSTVYLPQLEDKVSDLFHQAVTADDAFLPDPMSTRFSEQPLVKVRFVNWIGLCAHHKLYIQGEHTLDGTCQLVMRYAADNAVPSRELRPFDLEHHHPVLSAVFGPASRSCHGC